jgi:hypothetical protein
LVILSSICLIAGVTLAGIAPARPVHRPVLEYAGGSLIGLGLLIIAAGLPVFR